MTARRGNVVKMFGDSSEANPEALRRAHWETTDPANADDFVAKHGDDLRFAHNGGGWHIWQDGRWAQDHTDAITDVTKGWLEDRWQAIGCAGSPEEREILAKHVLATGREPRLRSMQSMAAADRRIALRPDAFDADPFLFTCANGTIDLRTAVIREHRREDLISKRSPVRYDPAAEAPRFLEFVDTILDGDSELVGFMQRAGGYSLTGSVAEQCLFFGEGGGCNGKSTLLEIMQQVAGEYATAAAPSLLMQSKHEPHPTEIADLRGARVVSTVETERDRRIAEVKVKWLTGGDRIKARYMRADFFEFAPTFKFWLLGNHRPEVIGTDPAIWRRIYLIPFRVDLRKRLGPDGLVRDFAATLESELPGILAWFVRGAAEWHQSGLRPPDAVVAATQAYRAEMDHVGQWVDEHCEREPRARTPVKILFDAYTDELRGDAISKRSFGQELERLGFPSEKVGGVQVRVGIRLRSEQCAA